MVQDKAEAKLKKVQDRADAERKLKADKSKEWHKQQHEREQRRVQVQTLATMHEFYISRQSSGSSIFASSITSSPPPHPSTHHPSRPNAYIHIYLCLLAKSDTILCSEIAAMEREYDRHSTEKGMTREEGKQAEAAACSHLLTKAYDVLHNLSARI